MNLLKSIGVILLSLIVVAGLSHLTDYLLENNGILMLPFDDNTMGLKLFVTLYRTVYVLIGSYITAALAPANPMRLVLLGAIVGTMLGITGAVAMWHEPPHWYPLALVVFGFPAALLGGKLRLQHRPV